MSVQQVKKQFEELRGYLGHDVKGLERLKSLKDAVNVLRTSLAAAQEQAAASTAAVSQLVSRALAAETALASAGVELQSLRQQVANLTRELAAATKVAPAQEEAEDTAATTEPIPDLAAMKTVVKRLRTHLSYCPPAAKATQRLSGRIRIYTRESFSAGWSHEALWVLGASVALLCRMSEQVVICTDERIEDLAADENHEGFGRNLIQWFGKNNMDMSIERDRRAGFVHVRNVRDGLGQQVDREVQEQAIDGARSRSSG